MKSKEQILGLLKQAVLDELEGVTATLSGIDYTLVDLVQAILNSQGRVVLTGIGKSAIIAQKVSATLNSTGTPSVFMHAAEAIHGDLGMVQKQDLILVFSHSGNTPEIQYLVRLLVAMGNPLACISGNASSYLARHVHHPVIYTMQREACPLNLAPTTSTTLQLVLGDALAIALLSSRNFDASDFSKYHPGGNLGKRLYLTCKDIADANNKPRVQTTDALSDVIMSISQGRMGATAVFDQSKLVGIITDGDIRRMLQNNTSLQGIFASDLMSYNPKTITQNQLAVDALALLKENKISQLIVLNSENAYIGMIHIHDLHKEGIN